MANEPKNSAPVTGASVSDFDSWAAEASAKAKLANAAGIAFGAVVDPDPRLHYAVIDGDGPTQTVDRQKALHIALGFRHVPDLKVVGYRNPIVMAIPEMVYRTVLRQKRVADIQASMAKWGGMAFTVEKPVQYS